MSRDKVAARRAAEESVTVRLFNLDSANRSLPLVRRVVDDIVREYRELMKLRDAREELSAAEAAGPKLDAMRAAAEQHVARLNALQEELREVGCELKDWKTGLVDFPAIHDGRQVWLCWKLGEERVSHWHELHEGFSGRKLVVPGF
jgi:hypothetical protein